jgi:nitrogen regulatory protein PII-like uncharacterized protein
MIIVIEKCEKVEKIKKKKKERKKDKHYPIMATSLPNVANE